MPSQPKPKSKKTVWIVGVGRLGKLVAAAELQDGNTVRLFDVIPETIRIQRRVVCVEPDIEAGAPDRTWFTVPDDEIAEVAAQWATAGCAPKMAIHTSGWHLPDILKPLGGLNTEYLSLHPMKSIQPNNRDQWRDTVVSLCGSPKAVAWAKGFLKRRHAKPMEVAPEMKRTLHLLSQLVANIPYVLVESAYQLASRASLPADFLQEAILTMMRGSTDIAVTEGVLAATGPIARGDAQVVHQSIQELQAYPQLQSFYREYAKLLLSQLQTQSPEDSRTAAWKTIKEQLG
ncbi:MAG: DUF2520 domain-containing protein [bacterium]|nr:DUF2520 domain-containing protein [bacterium]